MIKAFLVFVFMGAAMAPLIACNVADDVAAGVSSVPVRLYKTGGGESGLFWERLFEAVVADRPWIVAEQTTSDSSYYMLSNKTLREDVAPMGTSALVTKSGKYIIRQGSGSPLFDSNDDVVFVGDTVLTLSNYTSTPGNDFRMFVKVDNGHFQSIKEPLLGHRKAFDTRDGERQFGWLAEAMGYAPERGGRQLVVDGTVIDFDRIAAGLNPSPQAKSGAIRVVSNAADTTLTLPRLGFDDSWRAVAMRQLFDKVATTVNAPYLILEANDDADLSMRLSAHALDNDCLAKLSGVIALENGTTIFVIAPDSELARRLGIGDSAATTAVDLHQSEVPIIKMISDTPQLYSVEIWVDPYDRLQFNMTFNKQTPDTPKVEFFPM